MISRADLVLAVESAINVLASRYSASASEPDLYEASLLALAVDAARAAGGTDLLTSDGNTAAPDVTFRMAPGNIWSGSYTYVLVTFPNGKQLEIHLGVMVAGRSSVAHECDVAILSRVECERSRAGRVQPRHSGLIAAVEAKFYVASPGIGIGRGFLGLGSELGSDKCALAFPAAAAANLDRLIARKRSNAYDQAEPGSPNAEILKAHLQKKIKNWLA
jgi:hypothetical protein